MKTIPSYLDMINSILNLCRDDDQLLGRLNLPPNTDCEPFLYAMTADQKSKLVAPCGAIANSLFNGKVIYKTICFKLN